MTNTNNFAHVFGAIVISVALLVVSYLTLQRVDKYLTIKAVDDCAKASRYEGGDATSKFFHPLPDHYKACLELKGVSK